MKKKTKPLRGGMSAFIAALLIICASFNELRANETFNFEGVYYRIISNTENFVAEVVSPPKGRDAYKGEVIIVDSVKQGSKKYPVTRIGEGAFSGCVEVTGIKMPNTIKELDINAFRSCIALENITLPEQLKIINDNVFNGCKALKTITIPEDVIYIGNHAFAYCQNLQELIIPDKVESIEEYAFAYCSSLEKIRLGKDVNEIGINMAIKELPLVWYKCDNLKSIVVDDSNPWYSSYHGSLYNKEQNLLLCIPPGLESVDFSPFATTISNYAGAYNENIVSLVIPDQINFVKTYAFKDFASIKNIVLGKGMERIDNFAFISNYATPEKIISLNPVPPYIANKSSFSDKTYLNTILYVPKESIDLYKTSPIWHIFKNIRSLEESGIDGIVNTEESPKSVYTIQGIKVADPSNLQPGLYIINGKKTLIKNN